MSQATPAVDPLFLSFQFALAGRYSIDRELGRGGMGIVYLAREVHLDRLVAIKLLPPAKAHAYRDRFLREARLAAKLSHPNIIPIHAVEETSGFVYYVMAYVDGETLTQRVRTRGPLPSSEGARVLREVAWALAYAHGQGLVHRDVKPDNILLETSSGRVLVADFGIAAAAGDAQMLEGGVAGTPEFMSPEQVVGGQIDARSDLYGLGATAFYAFSGRFPFEGKNATEVLAKQVTEPPPPLASLGLTVPRKLATLVDRCLAKDPNHRPASAQALAEQLGVALEQRRELPTALRAFVKRQCRLNGAGTLIAGITLLPTSVGVAALFGLYAGFGTLFLGLTAAPLAYFVGAARRLMIMGFAHQDLGPAFKGEIEQSLEELSIERYLGPSTPERWLPRIATVTGAAFGVSLLWVWLIGGSEAFAITMGLSGPVTLLALISFLALRGQRRDVDTEFWAKVWMGRIGKFVFSIAKKFLGKGVRQSAMTHRATELSLGLAAEQLYESLPKETRLALGDLPTLLKRLQGDAQSLRKRHDELQEALGDVGDDRSPEYAEVRALRDSIHEKLGDAVAALETIRLNLLRLHAGSATVEGLTTHLGLAAEVSEEVERLIAAHDEVERSIKFPRLPASTPV